MWRGVLDEGDAGWLLLPSLPPLPSAGAGIFLIPRNAPYWRRVSLASSWTLLGSIWEGGGCHLWMEGILLGRLLEEAGNRGVFWEKAGSNVGEGCSLLSLRRGMALGRAAYINSFICQILYSEIHPNYSNSLFFLGWDWLQICTLKIFSRSTYCTSTNQATQLKDFLLRTVPLLKATVFLLLSRNSI